VPAKAVVLPLLKETAHPECILGLGHASDVPEDTACRQLREAATGRIASRDGQGTPAVQLELARLPLGGRVFLPTVQQMLKIQQPGQWELSVIAQVSHGLRVAIFPELRRKEMSSRAVRG
jgi:hypothetical protein